MKLPATYARRQMELPDNDQHQCQFNVDSENSDSLFVISQHKEIIKRKDSPTKKSVERKLILCRAGYCRNNKPYPYVILKGIWLRQLGFCPGDQVVINSPGKRTLIIQVIKNAEEVNKERLSK